ncbi:hypothetical protein HAX54_030169, partial [Datura stramonium]|nr:hypothetical protein [Datura stramonium]
TRVSVGTSSSRTTLRIGCVKSQLTPVALRTRRYPTLRGSSATCKTYGVLHASIVPYMSILSLLGIVIGSPGWSFANCTQPREGPT